MTGPYTDHHVHILASAAARLSIDVSAARSMAEVGGAIRAASAGFPRSGSPRSGSPRSGSADSGWLRAWGYEEWALAEGRHPTRSDLDDMIPGRPLVLHHRSGHAAVLNSAALSEVGEAGHPDGILFDRHEVLARVPRLDAGRLAAAAARLSEEWERHGVVAVVDATHTNGAEEITTLAAWWRAGVVRQRVTAMVGADHAGTVGPYGASVDGVGIGAVKLMPPAFDEPADRLRAAVAAGHAAGFPVAVHVVDVDVLDATLAAFEASPPPSGSVDRIEHNALCLPEQVGRIAACRATVVVNPSFLRYRRPKYELQLAPVEREWLIRIRSLIRAGIDVRAGSDSPVVPSRPAEMMAAAMAHPFNHAESVGLEEAERLLRP